MPYNSMLKLFQTKDPHLTTALGSLMEPSGPVSRPRTGQRAANNGHKRVHALKFQSLVLPNGLTGNIFGPFSKYFYFAVNPSNGTISSVTYSELCLDSINISLNISIFQREEDTILACLPPWVYSRIWKNMHIPLMASQCAFMVI